MPETDLPELSIVIPALNEVGNVGPLVEQVETTVRGVGVDAELVIVDDGSTDGTAEKLAELQDGRSWLRVLRRQLSMGQSSAMAAGIAAAHGEYVATLDADLQNDPAELPKMLAMLKEKGVDFVQGDRSADRQDTFMRRRASGVGRFTRRLILGDPVRDTGCSARVLKASLAKQLPLQFKGMHRFFPAYAARLGATIAEFPVKHRPRTEGETKYGVGVLTRGLAGLFDCFAVRWMGKRLRDTGVVEVERTRG
ncbi:MAG: glycosyltransferase family 2 protein [Planctomycetota bacterium]